MTKHAGEQVCHRDETVLFFAQLLPLDPNRGRTVSELHAGSPSLQVTEQSVGFVHLKSTELHPSLPLHSSLLCLSMMQCLGMQNFEIGAW